MRSWKEAARDMGNVPIPDYDARLERPPMAADSTKKWAKREGSRIDQFQSVETQGVFFAKSVHRYECLFLAVLLEIAMTVNQLSPVGNFCLELAIRRFGFISHVLAIAKDTGALPDWGVAVSYMGCLMLVLGATLTSLEREKFSAGRLKDRAAIAKELCKEKETRKNR